MIYPALPWILFIFDGGFCGAVYIGNAAENGIKYPLNISEYLIGRYIKRRPILSGLYIHVFLKSSPHTKGLL